MLDLVQTAALLRGFDRILILTHVRPDGDTVGCAAGLCAALRALDKVAFVLPNPEITETYHPYLAPYEAPEGFVPDRVVTVDMASLSLLPDNAVPYQDRIALAIDHHPSFERFGAENYVRPDAGACGEILFDIVSELGPVTPEIALPLYVAVSTDTGCFAYANTTANTHQVAAALLETGIDYRAVNKILFRTKSRKRLMLESAMLSAMEFYDKGRIVVLTIPLSLIERVNADESDAEDLSALGAMIGGTDCAVTLRELRPEVWKISLRTGKRINATNACRLLGGGGHAAAAGCTIEAPLAEAKEKILAAVASVAEQ